MIFQQQQNFSVELQSRLIWVRDIVVTDNSGGTAISRSERLMDLLRQRRPLSRVERVRVEEHHE